MTVEDRYRLFDRTLAWVDSASPEVAAAWRSVSDAVERVPPDMGLAAGERPCADVEVLATAVAECEYLLAARLHAAAASGGLPLGRPDAMLTARAWSISTARRLARCGALAAEHESLAAAWSAGIICAEHIDPVARAAERFTPEELAVLIAELEPQWGAWSPAAIARFVEAADRLLHPPADPTVDEGDAYATRNLSFGLLGDSVVFTGTLPRLEGEVVIAAIDAFADRLRSTAEHVPAAARRADALVELVNTAHAAGTLPSRGGLPVALTITLEHTSAGDPLWSTSRGHGLTEAEARWAACDAAITPIRVRTPGCCPGGSATGAEPGVVPSPAVRIAALAATMFGEREILDAGRTQRTASSTQRRALAVRDRGCIIPGCGIPAEACQVHHLTEWASGGASDLQNLALLCWAHHRQVDLLMWQIEPSAPPLDGPATVAEAPGGAATATASTPESHAGWPANHGAPFTIRPTARTRWRC